MGLIHLSLRVWIHSALPLRISIIFRRSPQTTYHLATNHNTGKKKIKSWLEAEKIYSTVSSLLFPLFMSVGKHGKIYTGKRGKRVHQEIRCRQGCLAPM
jgi:hypothetical protein